MITSMPIPFKSPQVMPITGFSKTVSSYTAVLELAEKLMSYRSFCKSYSDWTSSLTGDAFTSFPSRRLFRLLRLRPRLFLFPPAPSSFAPLSEAFTSPDFAGSLDAAWPSPSFLPRLRFLFLPPRLLLRSLPSLFWPSGVLGLFGVFSLASLIVLLQVVYEVKK